MTNVRSLFPMTPQRAKYAEPSLFTQYLLSVGYFLVHQFPDLLHFALRFHFYSAHFVRVGCFKAGDRIAESKPCLFKTSIKTSLWGMQKTLYSESTGYKKQERFLTVRGSLNNLYFASITTEPQPLCYKPWQKETRLFLLHF